MASDYIKNSISVLDISCTTDPKPLIFERIIINSVMLCVRYRNHIIIGLIELNFNVMLSATLMTIFRVKLFRSDTFLDEF